jgi:hypothetical protein
MVRMGERPFIIRLFTGSYNEILTRFGVEEGSTCDGYRLRQAYVLQYCCPRAEVEEEAVLRLPRFLQQARRVRVLAPGPTRAPAPRLHAIT